MVTTTAELDFDEIETKRETSTQNPTVDARSESISRKAIPFYAANVTTTEDARAQSAAADHAARQESLIKAVGPALIVLVLLFLARRAWKRKARTPAEFAHWNGCRPRPRRAVDHARRGDPVAGD
jgi:hypothetical protein